MKNSKQVENTLKGKTDTNFSVSLHYFFLLVYNIIGVAHSSRANKNKKKKSERKRRILIIKKYMFYFPLSALHVYVKYTQKRKKEKNKIVC